MENPRHFHTEAQTNAGGGRRLIFVGGAPRSGTTLVQNVLDSHPDILGGPEFLHLEEIMKLRRAMRDTAGKGWTTEFHSLDDIDGLISQVIDTLLVPIADRYGRFYLSAKTPGNVFVFEDLMDLYPRARFVNVVRDPRAVIALMLRVGARAKRKGVRLQPFTRDVGAAIRYMQQSHSAGDAAALADPERVLTVRYEDLVTAPATETRRMSAFLGVSWHERMLRPGQAAHIGEAAITTQNDCLWYSQEEYRRDLGTQSLDTWRSSLGTHHKGIITLAFARFEPTARLGHRLSATDLTPAERAAGAAYFALRRVKRGLQGLLTRPGPASRAALKRTPRIRMSGPIHPDGRSMPRCGGQPSGGLGLSAEPSRRARETRAMTAPRRCSGHVGSGGRDIPRAAARRCGARNPEPPAPAAASARLQLPCGECRSRRISARHASQDGPRSRRGPPMRRRPQVAAVLVALPPDRISDPAVRTADEGHRSFDSR